MTTVYTMGLLEPLPCSRLYAETLALTAGGSMTAAAADDWILIWDDNFETGDPISDHYEDWYTEELAHWQTGATEGNGGWGAVASTGSATNGSYWATVNPQQAEFATTSGANPPRINPGVNYLDAPRYGRAELVCRHDFETPTVKNSAHLFEVYVNTGAYQDAIFWIGHGYNYGVGSSLDEGRVRAVYPSIGSTASTAGVITNGTWQTIRAEWRMASLRSTDGDYAANSDGYIRIWVDGTLRVSSSDLELINDSYLVGGETEGLNCWNEVILQPAGRCDDLKIWKKS